MYFYLFDFCVFIIFFIVAAAKTCSDVDSLDYSGFRVVCVSVCVLVSSINNKVVSYVNETTMWYINDD